MSARTSGESSHTRRPVEGRRLREARDGHVAVQLHVLALAPQQLEHPVGELVLADALRADEQQVAARGEVEHQVAQHRRVPRRVEVNDLGHELRPRGRHDAAEPRPSPIVTTSGPAVLRRVRTGAGSDALVGCAAPRRREAHLLHACRARIAGRAVQRARREGP